MATYIVTYDLSTPARNYSQLYERIKSYGTWAQITESSYAVVSGESAVAVREYLAEALGNNDKLLVAALGSYAWRGLGAKAGELLKTHIG